MHNICIIKSEIKSLIFVYRQKNIISCFKPYQKKVNDIIIMCKTDGLICSTPEISFNGFVCVKIH